MDGLSTYPSGGFPQDFQVTPRVLVADGAALFRFGVIQFLHRSRPAWHIEEAGDVAALPPDLDSYDLALINPRLPGLGGMAGLGRLRTRAPALPMIALVDGECMRTAGACLSAGMNGVMARDAEPDRFLLCLDMICQGQVGVVLGPGAPEPEEEGDDRRFTPRQAEVMRLLVDGCSNKIIARRLGLSLGTVKAHLAAIYRALGVGGRTEALAKARWLVFH